jgi:hypothetical protein
MGLNTPANELPPLSAAECVETCHKIRDMIDGWFANLTTTDDPSNPPEKERLTHEDSAVVLLP